MKHRQLTRASRSSRTLDQQLGIMHGTKLSPMNVGYSYMAWFVVERTGGGWTLVVGPGLT